MTFSLTETSGPRQNDEVQVNMWSPVDTSPGGAAPRPAPCSRAKHSATLLGGHVYVLGGRGGGGALPLKDFWRYSLATSTWEKLACAGSPPPALQEHSAVAHGHRLYVFGGETATDTGQTPAWIYDTQTAEWRKIPGAPLPPGGRRQSRAAAPTAPRGRRGHSAHALEDCMLLYGGYMDLKGTTDELWAFHFESESWRQVRAACAGPARHGHAAALHDGALYVHGGREDLRQCADVWIYHILSRRWRQIRPAPRTWPAPRSGHGGLRAGPHLYVYGGDCAGRPSDELWRFHFASETWERIEPSPHWPSARIDCAALLWAHRGSAPAARPAPRRAPAAHSAPPAQTAQPGLMKEISRLSAHIRRNNRCSYTVLATDQDSTESLLRENSPAMHKSMSAYVIERGNGDGREEDKNGLQKLELSREPISVPDFADMTLPTPVLTPVEATKLVYLDSDDEEHVRHEMEMLRKKKRNSALESETKPERMVVSIPKSASVRFSKEPIALTAFTAEEGDSSTSDYASAERVNRMSLGFSNPHYLGPDVRKLSSALTPDSGVSAGDIELQDLGSRQTVVDVTDPPSQLHILLVGGKESSHIALMQRPLSMWTYRLL